MAIKSNSSIAAGISASFSQSASTLNRISISVFDSSTNVLGNALAVKSVTNYQQGLAALSTSVVSAGDAIHSVSKEFERIDQNIAQLTKFNLPGGFS